MLQINTQFLGQPIQGELYSLGIYIPGIEPVTEDLSSLGRKVPNLIRFEDLYPNFDTIVQQLTTDGGVPTIYKVTADGTGR